MIKKIIRVALGKLGYEIRRKDKSGFYASYLSQICKPKTVFNVGVGYGTPELYKAYPAASFFLIEPLLEFQNTLERLSGEINCRIYCKAIGATAGTKEINIEMNPELASFKDRPRTDAPLGKRQVEVTTLDAIFRENPDIETPILLKVDVEGCELEVLEGAKQLLQLTDIVIVEASVAKRFENSCAFEDVILFMKENGFAIFDFLSVCRGEGKIGTNLIDVAFRKLDKKLNIPNAVL